MYNSCFSLKNQQTKPKKPDVKKTNVESSVVLSYYTDRMVADEGLKARPPAQLRLKLLLGPRTSKTAAGVSAPGYGVGSVWTSCSPSPLSQSYRHLAPHKHLGHPASGQARVHSLRDRNRLGLEYRKDGLLVLTPRVVGLGRGLRITGYV